MQLSDDEAIALATLHGAVFFHNNGCWWIFTERVRGVDQLMPLHPIETTNFGGFKSRGAIARAYCIHHGLDVTSEGNDGGVR